jgi:hypothetical protein
VQDFEKLGAFYLGNPIDPDSGKPSADTPLLYDSKDLVTHAVCVGMTGSGKTGLCIGLLEEAAIDGIPALVIDPKGDLANLLLTFPDLRPADFRPWINEDEARTKGLSPDDFAAKQAELWTGGLTASGQDGARIARLKSAVDFAIYTPGSEAGRPVSVLNSLSAPAAAILQDKEAFRDRIGATATSLLGLLEIDADPVKSREHVLISTILDTAWRAGENIDLASLIARIQTPPFKKIGVMDLETFYPSRERFELALSINNLLASPGFQSWLEGEPLEIGAMLYGPQGKPRVSIFSIAHLNDAERMFFVSLLLNQTLGWVRSQSGTTSLRAILYMDEIFGYFPPVANPPSKKPLLTLLKQARAYGLGIVLATQNPVDLDYKGLSNTGTWFIGRLQTERDKLRVLDGLEGAAGEAHAQFDRAGIDRILSGLDSRVFLLNNVHDDEPVLFKTRWTLSYLRGPMTLDQIRRLEQERPATATSDIKPEPAAAAPVLPPEIPQFFVPVRETGPVVYTPCVVGAARIHYLDEKKKVDQSVDLVFTAPIAEGATAVDWTQAEQCDFRADELEREPAPGAQFEDLPSPAAKPRNYPLWTKAFTTWLFQTQKLEIYRSPNLAATSLPGESERDFRIRMQQTAREERDLVAEALREKYAARFRTLEERKRRAEIAKQTQEQQKSQAMFGTAISVGASILGAFLGRKSSASSTLGKAATAARQAGRTYKEGQDVAVAAGTVEHIDQQLAELQQQFDDDLAAQQAKLDPMTEPLDTVCIRAKRTNISVQLVALAWRA